MTRKWTTGLSVVLLAATLAGCDKGEDKDVIAIIPKGTTHVFWKSVEMGARREAKKLGVKIVWKSGQKEDDLDSQVTLVEHMIARGVKGICLAPLHDKALAKQVRQAKAAGIPVVIFDSALEGDDYVTFVGTDSYKGGRLGADEMIRLLGATGGKLVVLRYLPGHASTTAREKGFIDRIEEYNKTAEKTLELVSTNQYGGSSSVKVMDKAESMLKDLKAADGVYTPNEPTTFGMLRVLEQNDLAGKIRFVGFDGGAKLAEGLANKHIDALVLQDPVEMGRATVRAMVAHLRGEKVEKTIDTGCSLATPANMKRKKVARLLVPDIK